MKYVVNVVNREDHEVMVYFDRGFLLHDTMIKEHEVMKVTFEDKKPLLRPRVLVKVHAADSETGQMVRVNGTSEVYILPPKDERREDLIIVGKCTLSTPLSCYNFT